MHTLREILHQSQIEISQSVYRNSALLDFVMPVDDGFELSKVNLKTRTWQKIRSYQDTIQNLCNSAEYQRLSTELANLQNNEHEKNEKKAELRAKIRQMKSDIAGKAFQINFPGANQNEPVYAITYKSGTAAIDLEEIIGTHNELTSHPWFLSDIDWFAGLKNNTQAHDLGMEGGYCILGTDEMLFHIFLHNGEEHIFDFNTMQEMTIGSVLSSKVETAFWDFVQQNKNSIERVSIECDKDKLTTDEYQELYYLFRLADFYKAKLVVSIPDMSYEKTFINLFDHLPAELFEPLHKKFLEHLDRLSDICIHWAEKFKNQFPEVETAIFHRRDPEFLNLFYECRSKYLNDYMKRHLAHNRDGRRDAIMDYICMPALPFYKWGMKEIIEVNRLEEYPSIEKSRRIHKGSVRIHSMLFPQEASGNGRTSCFYAGREYKKHITI